MGGTVESIEQRKTTRGVGVQQLFHKGPQQYQYQGKPKTDTRVGSREPDSLKRT